MSIPLHQTSYQPMAELYLDFPGHTEANHYRRELDLTNGLITVSYKSQGTRFTRESFASYPDQCIATRISADKAGSVSFSIKLAGPEVSKKDPPVACKVKSITGSGIVLSGRVVEGTDMGDDDSVIRFEVHLRVKTEGGTLVIKGNELFVKGASEATIKVVSASNFANYKTVDADPAARCLSKLESIRSKSFERLYRTHLDDYQPLFNRASISLGDPEASLVPTDERVNSYVQEQDYDLVALIFQYSRYLAISGSREGGLPLNLLGIWTLRPAWGSKYTCNINIQMNYWPMNPAGLPECNSPLFETLKDLAESGSITAREHYGADGWVLHHNWDLWCGTAPINKSNHGIWVGGSGWMSLHIWEHFLYTGDLEFLKEYYPVIQGAVQFYTDFLYEDEITGFLISGPSNSPENGGLVMGPTMDHQIIRSLFKAYILASKLLGDDGELQDKAVAMIERIAPNRIGQYGQLQEWLEDKDNPKNKHRHLSHLWGVYPGYDITWEDHELFEAARQSLYFRGDSGTGWSMAWKTNLWARLLDGEHALDMLDCHIIPGSDRPKKAGLYPNLLNANPPFVIDGNFGLASGVVEMLI
jgi:alpha-L-fucosidase 2